MNENVYLPEKRGDSFAREVYDWVESALTAVICVVLVFTFAARTVGVVGESMLPTLEDNDRLVATRLYDTLKREDIVVVNQPNKRHEPLIKRVIATEGQTVDIDFDTGNVFVDGKQLYEPYIAEKIRPQSQFDVEFPQVVPMGCVFVMGDNRNNSWDSRTSAVGMVDERYILGKVIYRVMPYDRFGVPE